MDTKNPNKEYTTTPEYAEYQRENFWASNEGKVPPFNTDPGKLEELAKKRLSSYASSNASQSYTHTANRQALHRRRIIPRMLVNTNKRDTRAEIWAHKVFAPIGFAPIGINKICHPKGELPVAKVAKELNLPCCLSTAGSQPIEAVAEANGEGPRFFQLYMLHDDELTISLLTRAHNSGFSACILTTSNYAFYHGIGADLGLSDPVFQKRLREDGVDLETMPNEAGAKWIDNVWYGCEISGEKPFAIKYAEKAVEVGFNGIVVSNHAGRQVDGTCASLDALPVEKVVDAVSDETYVMFDSGVRGTSDVFKALAVGAKFVLVGRLWVWSSSIMGDHGVRRVMKSLLADFDIFLNVAGFQNIEQMDRSALEVYPPGYPLLPQISKL
ncbi:hypothetical protein H2201_006351 [Coniosporium apollinis]|uniref:FMN hydroxy acid dehydrogenase domain-containing protein n=1 Tax=Coniosporium apollinis TaxID=61459 RepID=A0ABQ9NNX9_9PEZI|nr:hypothetical protein H2201_006351 [Coniosporium apollinis]